MVAGKIYFSARSSILTSLASQLPTMLLESPKCEWLPVHVHEVGPLQCAAYSNVWEVRSEDVTKRPFITPMTPFPLRTHTSRQCFIGEQTRHRQWHGHPFSSAMHYSYMNILMQDLWLCVEKCGRMLQWWCAEILP